MIDGSDEYESWLCILNGGHDWEVGEYPEPDVGAGGYMQCCNCPVDRPFDIDDYPTEDDYV